MPPNEVESRARALVAEHTGGRVEAVVSAEDVFGGFFVVLADRGVFVKELFGDLEIRNEYPWDQAAADEVEVIEGFGGQEVRTTVGDRALHLKRLSPEAADLIARRLRGEPSSGGVASLADGGVLPDAAGVQSGGLDAGSAAGDAADWIPVPDALSPPVDPEPLAFAEATPIEAEPPRGSPRTRAESVGVDIPRRDPLTAPPTPGPSGSRFVGGCLLTLVVLALAGFGAWQFVALNDALSDLDARVDREATLLAELERTRRELDEVRAQVAALAGGSAQGGEEPALEDLPSVEERGWPEAETLHPVDLGDSPSRGPAAAWVTLVEVSDFECPHCARVQPIIDELRRSYGKDLRMVYKHFPLDDHEHALPAARASECAHEQGKFWRLHDWFFAHQDELGRAPMDELVREAGGLNFVRWDKCWEADKHLDRIDADRAQAARFGVGGVPAFFINGRLVDGGASLAELERVIDQELARARDSGLPRAQFYRKFVLSE